jgi:hypothetical protein
MAVETIREFTDSRGIRLGVDREAGVIRGVKLLGLESSNGRTYLKEPVARAIGLYEGAKVNVDHPHDKPDGPRSYGDRMGIVENVRIEQGAGGLRGDFRANPKHALWEQLAWDAEHSPQSVGFSHNIVGKTSTKGGKTVVEEISRVTSVDLVADPATTRGLFEEISHREEDTDVSDTLTLSSLETDYPALVETIEQRAVEKYVNSEGQKERDEALKEALEKVDKYEATAALDKKRRKIDAAIEEAKLPKEAVSDLFRQTLLEAKDAERVKALIEERQELAKPTGQAPRSKEQKPEGASEHKTVSAADFLAEAQEPELEGFNG